MDLLAEIEKNLIPRLSRYCSNCACILNDTMCERCGSDDLMFYKDGWGATWDLVDLVNRHIADRLNPINLTEQFEQFVKEVYGSCEVAGFEYEAYRILKEVDPVRLEIMENDWLSEEMSDERILEVGCEYYWYHEVEDLLKEFSYEAVA